MEMFCIKSTFAVFVIFVLLLCMVQCDINVIAICNEALYTLCDGVVNETFPRIINQAGTQYNITGTVLKGGNLFTNNVRILSDQVGANMADFVIAFGDGPTVHAASCVAEGLGIPALVYGTTTSRTVIYSDNSVVFNPTHRGMAGAIATLIGKPMLQNAYIICQDTLTNDGFIDVFANSIDDFRFNTSQHIVVSMSDSDDVIEVNLLNIHDEGFRLIVVHCTSSFLTRLLRIADSLDYLGMGYAWMVTETALDRGSLGQYDLPRKADGISTADEQRLGLLAIEGYEENKYDGIFRAMVNVIVQSTEAVVEDARDGAYNASVDEIISDFRTFLREEGGVVKNLIRDMRRNPLLFRSDGTRLDMQYRLLNYVLDKADTAPKWKTVGYITENGIDLETVVWPGQTIFGPVGWAREHLTIVMRPAEPFIYIRGPVKSTIECSGDTACLRINSSNHMTVKAAAESFRLRKSNGNISYDIFCCEGIVVDILHSLAKDLNFDFLLYFQDGFNFGTYADGEWTGMMGDVYNGAADFMVGAISVTSERMNFLSFTEPFYYSAFNMISTDNERTTSWFAFLLPFESVVWGMIIVAAIVTAVVTSLLEWNSPFGLSPCGRRRERNYTLGSGLTMVFSIWFIHSVKTKSPKSWPSKVVQNVWAAAAIVILASYTSFLAAYLAGNAYRDSLFSVLDAQLSTKRVGVIKGTAVEEFTKTINADLHTQVSLIYVDSMMEAMDKLRAKEIDMYMDDTPILEYVLSLYDEECSIQYAAHDFGDNAYAFGFVKNSWLKEKISPLIQNYVERGYVDDLKFRYMGKNRQCGVQGLSSVSELNKFGFEHTVGLFVMLLIGIGISCLLLIAEHVTYFVILPKLKRCPPHSIWRRRNLEFFSQRLYRAINSEKVKHPALEIVEKIKGQQYKMMKKLRRKKSDADPTTYLGFDGMARLFTFQHVQSDDDGTNNPISDEGANKTNANDKRISDNVATPCMPESDITSVPCDQLVSTENIVKRGFPKQLRVGIDNPVFLSDDEDASSAEGKGDTTFGKDLNSDAISIISNGQICNPDTIDNDKHINNIYAYANNTSDSYPVKQIDTCPGRNSNNVALDNNVQQRYAYTIGSSAKMYETWPSATSRKRCLRRARNDQMFTYSPVDSHYSPATPERIVNELSPMCILCSDPSVDNWKSNTTSNGIELKDNRVKSDIRHHAMASISHRSIRLDHNAVETLSKEDLLVMWKRSEIELKTTLNRMLHQNHHLRQMINVIEESADDHMSTERSPSPAALVATKL